MRLFTVELFINLPVYIEVEAEDPDAAELEVRKNFDKYEDSVADYLKDKLDEILFLAQDIQFGTHLEVEDA